MMVKMKEMEKDEKIKMNVQSKEHAERLRQMKHGRDKNGQ